MRALAPVALWAWSVVVSAGDFIRYSPPRDARNAANDTAPVGAEMLTNGAFDTDLSGWTVGANWTQAAGAAAHSAGATATLAQDVTVTAGTTYRLHFVMSAVSAGNVTVTLGADTIIYRPYTVGFNDMADGGAYYRTVVASSSGTVAFALTPTTTFAGSIGSVSLKAVTGTAGEAFTIRDSIGGVIAGIRGSTVYSNLGIGGYGTQYTQACSTATCYAPLEDNTTGYMNTALGYGSMSQNTTGGVNTAVGYLSLENQTNGFYNVAVGANAMRNATHGWHNVSVGAASMFYTTTGFYNSCVGYAACYLITTGGYNTALGLRALYSVATQQGNTAVGSYALYNTTEYSNTGVGASALQGVTTGHANTGVGQSSGYEFVAGDFTNKLTTGEHNTFLGAYTSLASTTQRNNVTVVGYGATVDASNTVVLGNVDVTDVLASTDGGATVTAGAFKVGANTGVSGTVVVKGSDGNNCNLVFEGGILTSETCP